MFVDVAQVVEGLASTAAKLNLPFGDRKMSFNSRLAQEVGLWAEAEGRGEIFHEAAFRAYFVDGKNIALIPVLLDLIKACGLDRERGANVIAQRLFKAGVDADWALSRARGVTAVPTFFMGRDRLVGAQPYEALEKLVLNQG